MPFELLQNYVRDSAIRNREEDLQNPGEYNATTWDKIVGGLTGVNVEEAVDNKTRKDKEYEIRTTYKPQLERRGLTYTPGMTVGDAQNAIDEYDEAKKLRQSRQVRQEAYDDPTAREERRLLAEQRLDLLKSQEDNLAFQRLQAQRENDRYYDRLEREDARLRREGYQSLTAGLAALASAFAIV